MLFHKDHYYIKAVLLQLIFLLLLATPISAFPDFFYKQLSLQEGLSQTKVNCIFKDHKGIIWIGTRMGLNRYDQYELKSYYHESKNAKSLPCNDICFIEEDAQCNLWIGTNMGLVLYNRGEDNFTQVLYNGLPIQVRAACLTDDGIIFSGTGLWKYNYFQKQIHKLPIINNDKPIKDYLCYVKQWKKNILLIGTRWKGAYLYHLKNSTIEPINFNKEQRISSYYIDKNNNLWLSPYRKGIYCYNSLGNEIAKYDSSNSELKNNIILDIKQYGEEIWMATDGNGIARLNTHTNEFEYIEHKEGSTNSFPAKSVNCIYIDKSNEVWAGTIRHGLFNIREVYMHTYQDAPLNNQYGLSNKTAQTIYDDGDYIYIGTDGGGVNRFDKTNKTFLHYKSCINESVVSIINYSTKELIVSFYGKGLFFFNKSTGEYRRCNFVDHEIQEKFNQRGMGIQLNNYSKDKYHMFADQVYFCDAATNTVTPAEVNDILEDSEVSLGKLRKIFSNENIAYLYGFKNIFRLDNRTKSMTPIYYADYDTVINDVCSDEKGNLWIASNKGLIIYNIKNDTTKLVENSLFHEIYNVIYDPTGKIWIGAQGKLFNYDINQDIFSIYNESDGALANEYIPNSFSVSPDGTIYIGGTNGLLCMGRKNILDSDQIVSDKEEIQLNLMEVLLDGTIINHRISDKDELKLPYNSSITIKLICNTQDVFRQRRYRFKISGINKEIESNSPILALYSLPAGKYDITASCSNRDNVFTPPITLMSLSISPPWWDSMYFKTSLIILIVCMFLYFIYYINNKKEKKLQWELNEHKQLLDEEKIQFLINMNHELRTPLMLIYSPIKRLISQKQIIDYNTNQILNKVCIQANRMKSLIEMVVDVRKIEMGKDILKLSKLNFNKWIEEVANSFIDEYDYKGVKLIYKFDYNIDDVVLDYNKCEIIVSNLLVNALKFSNPNSQVILSTYNTGNQIRISIIDEGIGLSKEDEEHIFERFYQGTDSKEGSGIGLSYVKTLVEQQGGNIKAFNNATAGSTFYFDLPKKSETLISNKPVNVSLNDLIRPNRKSEKVDIEEESFDLINYSILIIEDHSELSLLFKDSMKSVFNNIYMADSVRKSYTIAIEKLPDIIVCDISNYEEGVLLCQKLKKHDKTNLIPLILLDSGNMADAVDSRYKSGADIILSKPIEIDGLLTIIRNLLKNRKQLQQYYRSYDNQLSNALSLPQALNNNDEEFILKLNNIIIENLNNTELNVEYLATKMGMSRTSLYKKIRNVININANDYINKLRLEKAIMMLKETDYSILDISEATGFSTQRYFSTFFKKMTGQTPRQYRKYDV